MAAGTKLVIQYGTQDGESVNHTWNYIDPSVTTQNVQGLIQSTLSSGSIFAKVPVLAKSAKLVTTTETDIAVS